MYEYAQISFSPRRLRRVCVDRRPRRALPERRREVRGRTHPVPGQLSVQPHRIHRPVLVGHRPQGGGNPSQDRPTYETKGCLRILVHRTANTVHRPEGGSQPCRPFYHQAIQ